MSGDLDVVVRGGSVITMDAKRRVVRADVVVRGDRIVAIGANAKVSRGARAIDARGCAVVPGFVQAHVHLCQALCRGMANELPLLQWLRKRIWPLEAAHDARSLRASADLGLAEMMRAGTTSILDMGTVRHQDVIFEAMRDAGIRGFSGKAMMDRGRGVPAGLRETTQESLDESERLAKRWRGAANGRLGYAYAPRFVLSCSEKLLRGAVARARAGGDLVHSHAAEHPAEREEVRAVLGVDDVDYFARLGLAGPDVLLAHGVQLTKAQMKRMAKAGTRVVHCPSANLALASGIADVVSMRAAGMVVALGADGAPCNNRMDPFTELRQAALLARVRTKDAAALAAMDALAMLTIDGARAMGIDAEVGSVEVGKKADLAVVRIDDLHHEPGGTPVERLVYSAVAADVTDVLIDGARVVERSALRALDAGAVLDAARREGAKLAARAKLK